MKLGTSQLANRCIKISLRETAYSYDIKLIPSKDMMKKLYHVYCILPLYFCLYQ